MGQAQNGDGVAVGSLGHDIATAIVRVCGHGCATEEAWKFTPRQLIAWCEIIERDHAMRTAQLANAVRVAFHADGDDYKGFISDCLSRNIL